MSLVFRANVLYIYVDGSSLQSPRRGAIAVRFIFVDAEGEEQVQDIQFPGYLNATNNQMELKACSMALEEAKRLGLTAGKVRIIIRTDSSYVVSSYTKAMFEWSTKGWLRRSGAPVLNADLWADLCKAMRKAGARVEIEWVKGHSKDEHNKAVDRMARQAARIARNAPLSLVHVRRKLSDQSVEPGSVKLHGQRLSIRIVTTEYLATHKIWKCMYEVVSPKSDYYLNVDIIYSDELMKAGHSYFVVVNDAPGNPRVVKVIREIKKHP